MADETTPLLHGDEIEHPIVARSVSSSVRQEIVTLASIALPASLGYAVQNSIQTISIAIIARSGGNDVDLSASAHGFMIAMVTAWVIALGGSTALDTLGSAANAKSQMLLRSEGATQRQKESAIELGVLLQQTTLVLLVLYIPFAVLWCFIEPILLTVGQPADVSYAIQVFLRRLSFGAPGYILFEVVKKFCIVQNSNAPTIVIVIAAFLNVLLNLAFVKYLGWGIGGCAIAVSITYYLAALGLAAFVMSSDSLRSSWGGFDPRRIFKYKDLKRVSSLAIPGVLMIGSEWIAFEIIALAAGNLDETSLAAQSVIMTFDQVLNTIPFGLGIATTSRIGNLLGEVSSISSTPVSRQRSGTGRMRIASQSATLFATMLGMTIGLALMSFRDTFGFLFSSERTTVKLVSKVIPLVATFQVFDGWVAANGGTLRGVGKQKIGAIINLVTYYALALPFGLYLAFRRQMGLQGLWLGNCLALGVVGFSEWIFVTLLDWPKEMKKVQDRDKQYHRTIIH